MKENLLLNVLPAPIAERLKQSEDIIADSFAEVTVLFADIVGFTELSGKIPPGEVVQSLNEVFSRFDTLVGTYGLEKIKTIVDAGVLRRVLALVEVTFSNSMIEAWWRSLRHQWLYLHMLDDFSNVMRLISFYVLQHNTVMPHSAFNGQTPDEIYFGTGSQVPTELAAAQQAARKQRLADNRAARCDVCMPTDLPPMNAPPATKALRLQGCRNYARPATPARHC